MICGLKVCEICQRIGSPLVFQRDDVYVHKAMACNVSSGVSSRKSILSKGTLNQSGSTSSDKRDMLLENFTLTTTKEKIQNLSGQLKQVDCKERSNVSFLHEYVYIKYFA